MPKMNEYIQFNIIRLSQEMISDTRRFRCKTSVLNSFPFETENRHMIVRKKQTAFSLYVSSIFFSSGNWKNTRSSNDG